MRSRLETILRRLAPTPARCAMLVLACMSGALLVSMSGCADEGEGERCTFFPGSDAGTNGSTECAAGLICTANGYYMPTTTLTGAGNLGLCCPPPGTAATVMECMPNKSGSSSSGPPTGDGGFDGQVGDAKADAGTDAKSKNDARSSSDAGDGGHLDAVADGKGDAKHDAAMDAGKSVDAAKDGGGSPSDAAHDAADGG